MKYLIFSDESGSWNEGRYYIRSWVKITPENYNLLRKEIIFAKHETGIKELKWKNFKKNYEKLKNIFNVDFEIFITISKPDHFKSRKYNIIDAIEKMSASTGTQELTEKIKNKIVNSVKNELFFNYFEKTHIKNSKDAFVANENSEEYEYIIDTPQYLDREWEEIARECGIKQISIEKSSANVPGVELADVISGCIMDLLESKEESGAIYNECIKKKMLDMTSIKFPNPNLVFYQDFTTDDKDKINIFR